MTKLSISQAWDESKAVLARDGKLIATVALALFVLPGVVLDLFMPEAPAGKLPPAGAWMGVALVAILISLVGQLAIIRLAMNPHLTVGEAIVHGGRRLLPYVAAVLVWALPLALVVVLLFAGADGSSTPSPAAGLGLIAISIAGIFLVVRFLLLSAVASAEEGGPIQVLRRSWDISSGNWWRLFGFLLAFAIGALVTLWAVGAVAGLLSQLAFGSIGRMTPGGLIVIIVSQLVTSLVYLIYFVMLARLYAQRSSAAGVQASVPSSGT